MAPKMEIRESDARGTQGSTDAAVGAFSAQVAAVGSPENAPKQSQEHVCYAKALLKGSGLRAGGHDPHGSAESAEQIINLRRCKTARARTAQQQRKARGFFQFLRRMHRIFQRAA